jgi:hypothetical protein
MSLCPIICARLALDHTEVTTSLYRMPYHDALAQRMRTIGSSTSELPYSFWTFYPTWSTQHPAPLHGTFMQFRRPTTCFVSTFVLQVPPQGNTHWKEKDELKFRLEEHEVPLDPTSSCDCPLECLLSNFCSWPGP